MKRVLMILSLGLFASAVYAQDGNKTCPKPDEAKSPIEINTGRPNSYLPGAPDFSVRPEKKQTEGSKPVKYQYSVHRRQKFAFGRTYNGGMPGSTAPYFVLPDIENMCGISHAD